MSIWRRINWINTLFLVFTPLIAIVGTVLFVLFGLIDWPTWILGAGYALAVGFSITAGYHRLFAHKCYKAVWPIRCFFILMGTAAFEGSVLEWCTDHRNHHRYTDTDNDPYNIKKGFWFAHIGWIIFLNTKKRDFNNVADLAADSMIRFQHKYFSVLAILMGFILPVGIAALWGNALGGLIVAGFLRVTFNHHATFFINSICHMFGKRKYSDLSARDNWITALLTLGEGYHNFHHQFPIDYRNGIRVYHFDPTKWLIRGLSFLKLTTNLKRVSSPKIIRYQVCADEKRLSIQIKSETFNDFFSNIIKPMHQKILQLLAALEALEQRYANLKFTHSKKANLKMHRYSIKQVCRELNWILAIWSRSTQRLHRLLLNEHHRAKKQQYQHFIGS